MKSKQLNFFITPKDRDLIDKFLIRNNCVILLDRNIGNSVVTFKSLNEISTDIFQIYLVKGDFVKNVKILSTNNIKYYDNMISPILQFNLGGFYPYNTNLLQRARFYYVTGYYNEKNEFIEKSIEFIKWSNSLIKDFKKEFLKKFSKDKTFMYSESVIQWIEENKAKLINGAQQWDSSGNVSDLVME